jgi:23S rRNA (cytosine1962-C5)-methyltransferase
MVSARGEVGLLRSVSRDPAEWIVCADDDVVAVNKPVGVPCEARDPVLGDALAARIAPAFAMRDERDGPPGRAALALHHSLDSGASGVVLYGRTREANAALARQLEDRSVEREFVVGVTGWAGGARVLRHRLTRGEGPAFVVAGRHDGRAREAEVHVRVLARQGERAWLACAVLHGNPLTLRAQLAAEGSPIVGDALHAVPAVDEASAPPRLLMHARRLALRHPRTGAPLVLVAPPPRAFDDWLRRGDVPPWDDDAVLRDRLEDAARARYGLLAESQHEGATTTAFRLVNEHGDGLPGLAVDVYGAHFVAQFLSDDAMRHEGAILDALASLGPRGVYVKYRPRQANVVVDARRDDLAPSLPVRGGATQAAEFEIREHGLGLSVRLGDGLSTGLFLDQREARRRVRTAVAGARVLNLFAYTCAFSAAAAAGGAACVVSVDASREVLARGEQNVARARAEAGAHGDDRFLRADVFEALSRMAKSDERFDLVIVDPPTYATTRASRWTSGASWRGLVTQCVRVLAPGGRLLASSNDRRLGAGRFRRLVDEGVHDAGRRVRQQREVPLPRDFPVAAGREPHLKSLLVALD